MNFIKESKEYWGTFIAILLLLSCQSAWGAKKKSCADEVASQQAAEVAGEVDAGEVIEDEQEFEDPLVLIERVAKACGAWIKKNRSVPSIEQLSAALKIESESLAVFFANPGTPDDMRALVALAREDYPDSFTALRTAMVKKAAAFFKDNLRQATLIELAELMGTPEEQFMLVYGDVESVLEEAKAVSPGNFQMARNKIIRAYARVSKRTGRTPALGEVAEELEIEEQFLVLLVGEGQLFETMDELKAAAQKKSPASFKFVVDTDIFNQDRTDRLVEAIRIRKRLIVTTAVAGSPVNEKFLGALLYYAKKMDAEIIVFPANMRTTELDPILMDTPGVHVLTHSIELSPWLSLNTIKLLAKQINPLMGLDRIGPRGQSQIIGSPKMHVRTLATIDNADFPHSLMTTGAITDPFYSGELYIQARTDRIAAHDHVVGALILEKSPGGSGLIELESAGHFHLRHVEYVPEREGFMDLGTFYTATGATRTTPKALVLGDIHRGDTDQRLLVSLQEQLLKLKPSYVVIHDLLNGYSVSPHERNRVVSMAAKARKGELNLEHEINQVVTFVNALLSINSSLKVVIVPSNHDFWLHRWLNDGQFMREPQNTEFGLELARAYSRGEDPLKYALTEKGVEWPKRMIFLERGASFKVGEEGHLVELGQHGHVGANGGPGSLRSMLRGFDRIVFGHTHTFGRLNGAVNIGTFTNLQLSYNREGFSNWVQSLAIVGENGEIQPLRFREGEWFTTPSATVPEAEQFFMPGYPKVIPNNDFQGGAGQFDQWGGNLSSQAHV